MTRPFFNKDRISDFEIFEKHAEDAIEQVKARLRQGYPVDFQVLTLPICVAVVADRADLGHDISIHAGFCDGVLVRPRCPLPFRWACLSSEFST